MSLLALNGNELLTWLIKNRGKNFIKINAKIPLLYPDVINYAKKNGFELEGIDKMSFVKNGTIYDKAILGLRI